MDPDYYPTRDGEGIMILRNKECIAIHYEDPRNLEPIHEKRGADAVIYSPDSIVRFYPQGWRGDGYFSITDDSCISELGGESVITRRNGGEQGPYPSRGLPPMPPAWIQPSNDSQSPIQYRFGLQHPTSSNHISQHRTDAPTVDPTASTATPSTAKPPKSTKNPIISSNFDNSQHIDGRFKDPHSVFANFSNHQTANSQFSSLFNDGPSRGPRWQGIENEELDM
jgi:hypothetical protein